ncbi:MAG: family 16 glycoside hydrolase [Planctomycetota bacterium]
MKHKIIGLALALATSPAFAKPTPADVDGLALGEGLSLRVYDLGKRINRLPTLVEGQTANVNRTVSTPDLEDDDFGIDDLFYSELTGYLVIEQPGEYEFSLVSDDGSAFLIGDQLVIGHDGLHGTESNIDSFITLEAGHYPIRLRHFDKFGGAVLRLSWRPPGSDRLEIIPAKHLRTETDQVRVTSPGKKEFDLPTGDLANTRRPGDRRPLMDVHPATRLVDLRPDGFEPAVGGIDFLPDGRMVVCLWEPEGRVVLLDGVTGSDVEASEVTVKTIASGLAEPLGIKVLDGDDGPRLFVLQKQELTELIDHDGDEVIDEYRAAVSGWPVSDNFHEFAFGLAERDGLLYGALALAINPGGFTTVPQVPGRGELLEMNPDTGEYRAIAAGLRTPNGIGYGEAGEIYILDNQGDWLPSSKVLRLEEGAFYNSRITPPHPFEERPVAQPVAWLPQGEVGNSPTSPTPVPAGWGPYAGQQFHGDVTHGGVKRVDVEAVIDAEGKEVWQGCVFRFSQGLEAGSNRMLVGPDGDLYVGGIGSTGNWGQTGKLRFGLQKLTWTGDVPFEMLHVFPGEHDDEQGIEIVFTTPLAEDSGTSPASYRIRQWTYEPNEEYGGPKIDTHDLSIDRVTVSPDRTKAYLHLADETPMIERYVVHVVLRSDGPSPVRGEGEVLPWTTEGFYTLNALPMRAISFSNDGFSTLFDGTPESFASSWRGYKRDDLPEGWIVDDGELVLANPGAGTIVTKDTFESFDLSLEWKVGPGGNSGIFYRVAEDGEHTRFASDTGPEMQVLDDLRHPNGQFADQSAGALYDMVAVPEPSPVRPAGEWNAARILVEGDRFRHYLNGELVADVTLGSDDWNQRLADSKFRDWPRFAKVRRGHIGLQDHGDVVRFRNIRIKSLDR